MSIEFRNVGLAPLVDLSASAPDGAIIGVIGEKGSGAGELMQLAGGVAQPDSGEVVATPERRLIAAGEPLNLAPAAVLALDQALAAQDAVIRMRTLVGLDRMRRSGATIFLASHETALLETACDEVWWLHEGRLAARGGPRETLERYRRHVNDRIRAWGETIPPRLAPVSRHGNGRAEVLSIETLGAGGNPTVVWRSGEQVEVRVTVRYHEAVENPVIGLMIRSQIGVAVYGTNTELEQVEAGPRAAGETITVAFAFLCDLCPNPYTLTLASHDPDGTAHDWLDDAVAVTVIDDRPTAGVANLRAKVTVEVQDARAVGQFS